MNNASGSVADRTRPGELMRLVARGLARNGFRVHLPRDNRGCRLTIDCQGARCALWAGDWGDVELEWSPHARDHADSQRIADLATTLLTGHASYPRPGKPHSMPGVTLKGIVGLELQARGLQVDLEVYEDRHYFEAQAEIVVTSSATGQDATVRVSDDGSITWTRDYWAEAATVIWEPEYRGWIADPEKLADDVVETITRAMS